MCTASCPAAGSRPDSKSWIACRPGFFPSVRVLSRLFSRRFLEELQRVHQAGKLKFFGEHVALAEATAFKARLEPLRKCGLLPSSRRESMRLRATGRHATPLNNSVKRRRSLNLNLER